MLIFVNYYETKIKTDHSFEWPVFLLVEKVVIF